MKKTIYRGDYLKTGAWQKRGGVFKGGGDTPMHTVLSHMHKSHTKKAPNYMNEIFSHAEFNRIPKCYSYQKLKLNPCKTNQGLTASSCIGPSL